MIKVMIIDDEPYIRQGIKILINWEQYGFIIAGEASNGNEAINLLKSGEYDLVITDIRMPEVDGLELIEHTWTHISKNIRFIILSGFYEFEYAKKAIKYGVVDYVLKPVQKEELIKVLEDYKYEYVRQVENRKMLKLSEKVIFDRKIADLIVGKQEKESIEYVSRYLVDNRFLRYIRIEFNPIDESFQKLSNEEKNAGQRQIYHLLKDYLGENSYHAFIEESSSGHEYGVSFIYAKKLAKDKSLREREYISKLYDALKEQVDYKIILYIGQRMEYISELPDSYKTVTIAKAFQSFSGKKDIAYYDEIKDKIKDEITTGRHLIDKELMDGLVRAIEKNNVKAIEEEIESVYKYFSRLVAEPNIIKINLDYLLFNLIDLAKKIDTDVDQEEVYKMISQGGYEKIAIRGSIKHFNEFALEFSSYLSQLRHHAFGGVLADVEREVNENYMDNLTLKLLSEKYFINSAYLGQIFKKHYGSSFSDYLNTYRIDRAAEMLIRTDKKIYLLANAVGFNNTDYFISKFVQFKGMTPLQYRKQFLGKL